MLISPSPSNFAPIFLEFLTIISEILMRVISKHICRHLPQISETIVLKEPRPSFFVNGRGPDVRGSDDGGRRPLRCCAAAGLPSVVYAVERGRKIYFSILKRAWKDLLRELRKIWKDSSRQPGSPPRHAVHGSQDNFFLSRFLRFSGHFLSVVLHNKKPEKL